MTISKKKNNNNPIHPLLKLITTLIKIPRKPFNRKTIEKSAFWIDRWPPKSCAQCYHRSGIGKGKNLEAFGIDDLTSAGDLRPEQNRSETASGCVALASAKDTLSEMRPARVESDSRWKIAIDWSQRRGRLFPSFAPVVCVMGMATRPPILRGYGEKGENRIENDLDLKSII